MLYYQALGAQTPVTVKENSIGSWQLGLSSPLLHQNLIGLQSSYKVNLGYTRSYVGIEDVFCASYTKREWPGVGKYHYLNSINCISALLGMRFMRKYDFNFGSHLKFNYVNYDSKLKSKNPLIKEHVNNAIHWKDYGLGFAVYAQYFRGKQWAYYTDWSVMKNQYGHLKYIVSIGLSYQLKSKYN